jgi:predicted enzyme related to lactoylglutathione lyase
MQGETEAKLETEIIGKTPSLMFKVDDCKKTCDELRSKDVKIINEPEEAPYGIQALIVDSYGNPLWLIEPPM